MLCKEVCSAKKRALQRTACCKGARKGECSAKKRALQRSVLCKEACSAKKRAKESALQRSVLCKEARKEACSAKKLRTSSAEMRASSRGAAWRQSRRTPQQLGQLPHAERLVLKGASWLPAMAVVRGAQEYQRLAGLAHKIFLKLLKAKREVPGAAERQKTLAAQDGKRALCGCGADGHLRAGPRGAGKAGLCGQLCRRCAATHSEKTLESLESRVAPGVMEYVRSPKLPPLVLRRRRAQRTARTSAWLSL